jgi:hypothetical protein
MEISELRDLVKVVAAANPILNEKSSETLKSLDSLRSTETLKSLDSLTCPETLRSSETLDPQADGKEETVMKGKTFLKILDFSEDEINILTLILNP